MARYNFTVHPEIDKISCCSYGNMITKEYYDFLVGEINRGTIKKAVCRVEYPNFGYTSYHLLS